jgi:hypothetical protein
VEGLGSIVAPAAGPSQPVGPADLAPGNFVSQHRRRYCRGSKPEEASMAGYAPPQDYQDEVRPSRSPLWRGLRLSVWAVVSFALTFVELVAEWVAPLVLMAGLAWWGVLQVVGGIRVEPEIQQFLAYVPRQLLLGGTVWTPGMLITQGLTLLAVVAACRTLNRLISREI